METHLKAFFYDYKYYLFPDDCLTIDELKTKERVTAKRLKEERCMAPDFIYESITDETLEIEDADRLFEVYVNLYTGAEYDEILSKQVDRVCPGCERFIPDDDPRDKGNLDGHHREISLNGTCYEREGKDDYWDLATSADAFWYRISERLNELALCIDKNDQKKLNKIVGAELKHFFPETNVYGTVYEGKYTLCFQTEFGNRALFVLLLDYLAAIANYKENPVAKAGWKVLPYRPESTFRYKKELKRGRAVAKLKPSSAPFCYDVALYHPRPQRLSDKKAQELINRFYETLSAHIGEEKAYMVLNGIGFTSEKEGLVSIEAAEETFRKKYGEFFGENAKQDNGDAVFPAPVPYGTDGEQENTLPYREKITEGITRCGELTFLDTEILKEKQYWTSLVSFAYLYVPRPMEDAEKSFQTLSWYLQNGELVPEPLRNKEDTRIAGGAIGFAACGEEGFILDFIAASENKFFRMLRTLAPVLQTMRAKVVVVNQDGVSVYDCGYEFNPVGDKI